MNPLLYTAVFLTITIINFIVRINPSTNYEEVISANQNVNNNKNKSSEQKKPHIIIIIADDMGWNDVGFHGSNQIPTPNIDALAYNGIILNRFYTQHICTPSRAALLTGNYPIRSGMQGDPIKAGENRSLPLDMPLMPELLKTLGYRTHLVGKWHLGSAQRRHTPTARGFDTHFGYWNGYVGYFDHYGEYTPPTTNQTMAGLDLHDDFTPVWSAQGRYATDLFTEKALDIIGDSSKNESLFLVLSHLAAHTGRNGTELGVPDINRTNDKYSYIEDPLRRRYADIVNLLDESVGRVMTKLAETKMLDDAIVLFLSDNGAQTRGVFENHGSNWPLRGLKFTLYDGGTRAICAIYSKLLETTGYISNDLIHITDLLPTLYARATGRNLNKDFSHHTFDGIDQWDTLSKRVPTQRHEVLLNIDEIQNYSGLIGSGGELNNNGQYKLLNGTYQGGIYDGYYTDVNIGWLNDAKSLDYNVTSILVSAANIAIMGESLNESDLTADKIHSLRRQSVINCNNISSVVAKCVDTFCLFDLFNDPCETVNLIETKPDVFKTMKKRLGEYYAGVRPQTNRDADPAANPIYYNNTWCTWLDPFNTIGYCFL